MEPNDVILATILGQNYTFVKGKWFNCDDPDRGIQYRIAKVGSTERNPVAMFIKEYSGL